jgi:hypothetical protein
MLILLLAIPLGGVLLISTSIIHQNDEAEAEAEAYKKPYSHNGPNEQKARQLKLIALQASLVILTSSSRSTTS